MVAYRATPACARPPVETLSRVAACYDMHLKTRQADRNIRISEGSSSRDYWRVEILLESWRTDSCRRRTSVPINVLGRNYVSVSHRGDTQKRKRPPRGRNYVSVSLRVASRRHPKTKPTGAGSELLIGVASPRHAKMKPTGAGSESLIGGASRLYRYDHRRWEHAAHRRWEHAAH